MLVGFGAELNQRIVEDFPEIANKLVKNCISEQQMEYTLEAGYSEELVVKRERERERERETCII